jgi:Raf kinase inhibitor-like YbhB/YbcL family protein
MEFEIASFPNGGRIPRKYAMGIPDGSGKAKFGKNVNPHLRWNYTHEDTLSFAVICVDVDAPTVPTTVNVGGATVPKDQPRAPFYHWVLLDIHPQRSQIHEGEVSDAVKPKGKPFGVSKLGMVGINSYTDWFAGDPDMAGNYGGYDGPFPPWNDERVHTYHFKLFGLDVPSLELSGPFTGDNALKAMEGHIVEQAEWVGTYTLNASLIKMG